MAGLLTGLRGGCKRTDTKLEVGSSSGGSTGSRGGSRDSRGGSLGLSGGAGAVSGGEVVVVVMEGPPPK